MIEKGCAALEYIDIMEYSTLTSSICLQYQRDVLRALHVLRRNGWDLVQLLQGATAVLSW